jgi:hypothetical protein
MNEKSPSLGRPRPENRNKKRLERLLKKMLTGHRNSRPLTGRKIAVT